MGFVRGDTVAMKSGNKMVTIAAGDIGKVSSSTSNGWLRVKFYSADKVVSVRSSSVITAKALYGHEQIDLRNAGRLAKATAEISYNETYLAQINQFNLTKTKALVERNEDD